MSRPTILIASAVDELAAELDDHCRDRGAAVCRAGDAAQALYMAHQSRPDVMIMDADIPVKQAFGVFRLMNSDARLRGVRKILLVAEHDAGLQARAQELGITYQLIGPEPWSFLEPLLQPPATRSKAAPVAAEAAAPVSPQRRTPGEAAADAPLVLTIDDELRITKAIKIRLASRGYRVICAYNGVDGFAMAKAQRPDVITLDVGLPHMDGLGVMQNLTSHPTTSDIPIIVLTGRRDEDLERVFQEMGAFAYMTKPFRTSDLLAKVEQALHIYGRRRSAAKRY